MYLIHNPATEYYLVDLMTGKRKLLGREIDFLCYLQRNLECVHKTRRQMHSSWKYNSSNLAFNSSDMRRENVSYKNLFQMGWNEVKYVPRKESFEDGTGRLLDPRNYAEKAIDYKVNMKFENYGGCFQGLYYRERQRTKSCSGHSWRCQSFHNVCQAKKMEAMFRFDPEYKEYKFKAILDTNDPPKGWWDEKNRRVEGNWKTQYKVNRQYNVHTKGHDCSSIRKQVFEVNKGYTDGEVDAMLEADFLNRSI